MPRDSGRMSAPGRTLGRYHLANAREPAAGVGRMPRSRNASHATVAVQDPWADVTAKSPQRVLAGVNRKVDVLEYERSHGRITDSAYFVGRIAQAVFERATGAGGLSGGWQEGDRVDAEWRKETRIVSLLEDARKVKAYVDWARRMLGRIDANIIEQILGRGLSYSEVSALRGRAGERSHAYFAQRFRDALEALAAAQAARR